MKYEDISPKDLMGEQEKAMWEDIHMLWSFKDKFVEVSCPACGIDKPALRYEKYGMRQVVCPECHTQYINPRPPPDVLKHFYTNSKNYEYYAKHIFPATAESRREKIFKKRAALVAELCGQEECGRDLIIEVGLGYGFFCEEIKKLNLFNRVVGIEPTPHLAQICRDKNIEVIEEVVEKVQFSERADVIVNFEVIEHLFNPLEFLTACRKLLTPGGILMLTCPNISGFETSILEKESETIDHEHLNYFNPSSLSLLAKRAGLEVVRVLTPGVLDVDIVYQRWSDRDKPALKIDGFIEQIMMSSEESKDAFQTFLTENRLSSNMMLICKGTR